MQIIFLTNTAEERKDKETMEQKLFLKKYADLQAEYREYWDTIIQSKLSMKLSEERNDDDTTDQVF